MSNQDIVDIIDNAEKPKETLEQIIERLSNIPILEYDVQRKEIAKYLGIRVSTLDEEVAKLRPILNDDSEGMFLVEVEPWDDEVNGYELFCDLVALFKKYLALQNNQAEALALWSIFSYCIDASNIAPKLLIYSPEKRCGKTTLLDVLGGLVWKPLQASNITSAALFRTIDYYGCTIMIDEADTFINDKPEIDGIINSGHRKSGAFTIRLVGDSHEPKQFSTWAPNIIAMIGKPKDTIVDRSIMIEMRREKPEEKLERFLHYKVELELKTLARKISRWSKDNFDALKTAEPETITGLNDRASDNWRPLLAIADLIGGDCFDVAKQAAINLSKIKEDENESAGVMLLEDIKAIFVEEKYMTRISTEDLLANLITLEDRPWAEWNRGKEFTARQLSKHLKPYGISPKTMRIGQSTKKGYDREFFNDAFERYLSNLPVTP
jgi:putative DNA primase/helicase